LVGLFLVGIIAGGTGGEQTEQVGGPTVEQSSEATDEQTVAKEETIEEEAKE
jgi:hypothetical protein